LRICEEACPGLQRLTKSGQEPQNDVFVIFRGFFYIGDFNDVYDFKTAFKDQFEF
jgi:hypothetical protein